jgi:hypothetical protein
MCVAGPPTVGGNMFETNVTRISWTLASSPQRYQFKLKKLRCPAQRTQPVAGYSVDDALETS